MVSLTNLLNTLEYTKIINKKVVDGIVSSAPNKKEVLLDVSAYTTATSDYRTYLESFMAQLRQIDTALSKKVEKVGYELAA